MPHFIRAAAHVKSTGHTVVGGWPTRCPPPPQLRHQAPSQHGTCNSTQAPIQSITCDESLGLFPNIQKLQEYMGSTETQLAHKTRFRACSSENIQHRTGSCRPSNFYFYFSLFLFIYGMALIS